MCGGDVECFVCVCCGDVCVDWCGWDDDGCIVVVWWRGVVVWWVGCDWDGIVDCGWCVVWCVVDGWWCVVWDGIVVWDGRGDGDGDGIVVDGRMIDVGIVLRDGDYVFEWIVVGFVVDVCVEGVVEVVCVVGEIEKDVADVGGGGVREGV